MPRPSLKKLQNRLFTNLALPAEMIGQFFDDHSEGVIIVDIHTEIIYYNKAQGQIDDLSPAEAIGRTVLDLYRVEDNTNFPTLMCLFSRSSLRNHACFYRTHMGKLVNSIHNIFPLFNGQDLVGCICFISDYGAISSQFRTAPGAIDQAPARPDSTQAAETGTARYVFDDIVTHNPRFRQVLEEAKLAAQTPSPVMIYGESGTGKEMMAQAIHNHSPRRRRPFIPINCAAIPENLLEGILFGTAKGAFTGALDKPGVMELADGGTLFLDEINSMPMGLQSKILRAVQEQRVRRVGAAGERPVNLKIISAANVHPQIAVRSGEMRADLFYRLAVVLVSIPPLRDRKDDIAGLTRHFVGSLSRKLGKHVEDVSPQVYRAFMQYHWPGNARELAHALEGAMNIAIGTTTLELFHFNDLYATLAQGEGELRGLTGYGLPAVDTAASGRRPEPEQNSAPPPMTAASRAAGECEAMARALEETGGNASKAARLLGISPQLMHYKMKRYNLKKRCLAVTDDYTRGSP